MQCAQVFVTQQLLNSRHILVKEPEVATKTLDANKKLFSTYMVDALCPSFKLE